MPSISEVLELTRALLTKAITPNREYGVYSFPKY